MKLLLCCFFIFAATHLQAQQTYTDSTIDLNLPALNLTPEQKVALKKLIWDYKLEDRKRRRELRHRMFVILNVRQQTEVRKWWRRQIKNSMKRHP